MLRTKHIGMYWLILNSVFLVVFNVFFFMLTAGKNYDALWISYSFIHLSYFTLLLTPSFVRRGTSSVDWGRPLFLIATFYFVATLVVGSVFIGVEQKSVTAVLLTHIGILGVFLALFYSNLIINEHTADAHERHEQELQFVNNASSLLKATMRSASNSVASKKVEQMYDYIHSSPIKSSQSVREIEQGILYKVEILSRSLGLMNNTEFAQLSDEILHEAQERNRLLKLNQR